MFVIKDGIWKAKVPQLPIILICLVILVILTGCTYLDETKFSIEEWKYEHLRVLDPVDAEIPHLDIVAVYIAEDSTNLSIRIDFFDVELDNSQHFFVTIDYKPGGSEELPFVSNIETPKHNEWDLAIEIPSIGEIQGFDSNNEKILGLQVNVYRDTFLDTFIVNISKANLIPEGSPISLDIYTLEPFNGDLVDSVTSIQSSGLPPPTSKILLGFWNTFSAYTPAQVLRKWDGAHTGPISSRHGLKHLVGGSRFYGIPVALFDLDLGVAGASFGYLGESGVIGDFGGCFGGGCVLECAGGIDYTKSSAGRVEYTLSIDTRLKLVDSAFTGEMLCIGGDFSESLWGIPDAVEQVFQYIKEHPWIVPISKADLQTTPIDSRVLNYCPQSQRLPIFEIDLLDPTIDIFQKQFESTPDNVLKELAWQTYQTLLCPANKLDSIILENYFGQLGHILSAAEWVEKPLSISRCDIDLDWDGDNECVIASESMFLTVELRGGYISFAIFKDNDDVHQILGPMYEVVVGLGDPTTYKPEDGVFADTRLIPGAMASRDHHKELFMFVNHRNHIDLFSDSLLLRKTISFGDEWIKFEYSSDKPIDFQIPLILDPWLRYTPDWSNKYIKRTQKGEWIWGIQNHFQIMIKASRNIKFDTFLDSKELLNQPEDPNFEYPEGHYLPFPTAILDVPSANNAIIELVIEKP